MRNRKFIDLTGQKFDKLTVLRMVRLPDRVKNLYCECQCECGKITYVKSFQLLHGRIRSCGCTPKYKDITGQKFNFLTVLGIAKKPDGYKANHTFWHCKCDCGNEVDVDQRALKSGNTKSCGCYSKLIRNDLLKRGRENREKKRNRYIDCGSYYKLYTSNNVEFFIDKDDFEKVYDYMWGSSRGYITRSDNNKNKKITLHRFIIGEENIPEGMQIDHINRIKTDNRRCNLRIVTPHENVMNRRTTSKSKNGGFNVYYRPSKNKYEASFSFNNKHYWVGTFDDLKTAENAVLEKRKEIGGLLYDQRIN